jgi:hypothetical protein
MANLSTQNIGTNFKGMLNLGSTINTPLSTTLQAITDGDGVASPLQLATNRIALGTATGTSLLNFPDAGTTAADGISFGSTISLYKGSSAGVLNFAGTELTTVAGAYIRTPYIYNNASYTQGIQLSSSAIKLFSPGGVSIEPATLTGSQATSALSITQTWNTTGNPTAIFANITNTASGANANLMDLQIGGVSQFRVSKAGNTTLLTAKIGTMDFVSNNTIANAGDIKLVPSTAGSTLVISQDYSATSSASALLEVKSTTKGFLPPRMTTTQVNAIATPAEGLVVFNTTISHLCVYQSGAWVKMSHSPM